MALNKLPYIQPLKTPYVVQPPRIDESGRGVYECNGVGVNPHVLRRFIYKGDEHTRTWH